MLLSVVVRTKRWREKRIGNCVENFMAVEKFGLFSLFWSPRFWCCRSFFAHFWKEIGWEYDLRNKPCIYGLHIHASHTSYLCIHKYFPIFHCCQKAPITELSIILIVVWFHSKSMFSPFTHTHKFLWCGFLPGTNFTNWSLPNSLIGWVLGAEFCGRIPTDMHFQKSSLWFEQNDCSDRHPLSKNLIIQDRHLNVYPFSGSSR